MVIIGQVEPLYYTANSLFVSQNALNRKLDDITASRFADFVFMFLVIFAFFCVLVNSLGFNYYSGNIVERM